MWSAAFPACPRASLLAEKDCVTAQHYSFINQRHFHCPCTATRLLRLSLPDSSLIHLLRERGDVLLLPSRAASAEAIALCCSPSQTSEAQPARGILWETIWKLTSTGQAVCTEQRQDPQLDSCTLGVLPSPLQGRCLCPSPKYRHKTPVGARQSHPRSPNRPSRKAHDNAQIQAVAGWNWASLILATKTQYFGVANNKKVFSSKLYSSVC